MRRFVDFLTRHVPTVFGITALLHAPAAVYFTTHGLPAVGIAYGAIGVTWAGLSVWWWANERSSDG